MTVTTIPMHPAARLDLQYVWHPFTQMRDWRRREPIVIRSARGSVLRDVHGKRYLDGNASIWTNLHGHNHPKLNAALRRQLRRVAHSSALGLANEPAAHLAARLVGAVQASWRGGLRSRRDPNARSKSPPRLGPSALEKVFYSDDGSTAMEVALKLAYEHAKRAGRARSPRFLSLQGAYHGDTVGAVSLGHIDLFHKAYSGLLFPSDAVMAPYCYRCPFNRAKPDRADARVYRRCQWECVDQVERCFAKRRRRLEPYAAMVIEPGMQGAAGMIPQPKGWLRRVAALVKEHGSLLIADEVMTGFGRTGLAPGEGDDPRRAPAGAAGPLFACHHERVQPDFLALAKGMTGGYLPMAATLTTRAVFDSFLGEYEEFKAFFHGHSYTANQLGAAAALASLDILESRASAVSRRRLEETLHDALGTLWKLPRVGDVRRVGLVVGVELVRDWRTREPFDPRERAGIRVCERMARHGVLTRPIGNVVVLMPPYCTTDAQAGKMVSVLAKAIRETLGGTSL